MKTSTHYRSAPPPGVFHIDAELERPSCCPLIHADDRPNPVDEAKKADGSHDIGTEDGMHEIGLADFIIIDDFPVSRPQKQQPRTEADELADVDLCALRRECRGLSENEF